MERSNPETTDYDTDPAGRKRPIVIVTPAPPGSRRGNRVTADRWGRMLTALGHTVEVREQYSGGEAGALIVLHAGRCADSIRHFRSAYPDRPLLIVVTGTDIYSADFDRAEVEAMLATATRIVCLQPKTVEDLPESLRPRCRVVFQSAEPPTEASPATHLDEPAGSNVGQASRLSEARIGETPVLRNLLRSDVFEVAVVGHLRPIKDPFRSAEAVRLLPAGSRVRIVHLGAALTQDMADRAQQEMATNPRYKWLGDRPHDEAHAIMARCRLMAITSLAEGGPEVIAEAVVAGAPVVASRVAGCVGMLGDDYPGYFEPGDTAGLARIFERAEADGKFLAMLQSATDRLKPRFSPEMERTTWAEILAELAGELQ